MIPIFLEIFEQEGFGVGNLPLGSLLSVQDLGSEISDSGGRIQSSWFWYCLEIFEQEGFGVGGLPFVQALRFGHVLDPLRNIQAREEFPVRCRGVGGSGHGACSSLKQAGGSAYFGA